MFYLTGPSESEETRLKDKKKDGRGNKGGTNQEGDVRRNGKAAAAVAGKAPKLSEL